MAGAHFLTLLHATSRSSLAKPARPFFYNTNKSMNHAYQNYGQGSNGNRSRLMEERAPSTAEEFQRVAEEKAKMASQNVDESYGGGAQEGIIDNDSKVESVKSRFKEHEVGSDYPRRG